MSEVEIVARLLERRGAWDLGEFYALDPLVQAFWYGREVAIIEGRDKGPAKGAVTSTTTDAAAEADYLHRVAEYRRQVGAV